MDPSGEWENQNGSVLTIGPVENGTFEGTFVSSKGRAAAHRRYPVRGTVNGELLAFSVDFQDDADNLHSISNFTGRLHDGVLHTVWVLAREFEDAERTRPTQPWNTFMVNADRFARRAGRSPSR